MIWFNPDLEIYIMSGNIDIDSGTANSLFWLISVKIIFPILWKFANNICILSPIIIPCASCCPIENHFHFPQQCNHSFFLPNITSTKQSLWPFPPEKWTKHGLRALKDLGDVHNLHSYHIIGWIANHDHTKSSFRPNTKCRHSKHHSVALL